MVLESFSVILKSVFARIFSGDFLGAVFFLCEKNNCSSRYMIRSFRRSANLRNRRIGLVSAKIGQNLSVSVLNASSGSAVRCAACEHFSFSSRCASLRQFTFLSFCFIRKQRSGWYGGNRESVDFHRFRRFCRFSQILPDSFRFRGRFAMLGIDFRAVVMACVSGMLLFVLWKVLLIVCLFVDEPSEPLQNLRNLRNLRIRKIGQRHRWRNRYLWIVFVGMGGFYTCCRCAEPAQIVWLDESLLNGGERDRQGKRPCTRRTTPPWNQSTHK